MNRTVIDMRLTMLLNMEEVPKLLWAKAIHIAFYIRNRLITKSCSESRTPFEVIHGSRPHVEHFKNVGPRASVHIPIELREGKFEATSEMQILVE